MARLLAENVSFRCTSVDRIGIRGYVPGLQDQGGVLRFLLERGYGIPSPAGLAHNHDRLTSELEELVAACDVPVVRFRRHECKEDIARPYQLAAAAADRPGLVLVVKAQERTSSWRGFVDDSHAAHRPGRGAKNPPLRTNDPKVGNLQGGPAGRGIGAYHMPGPRR